MPECAAEHQKDWLSSRRGAWLIWGAPWALIIVGSAFGDTVHTVSWTLGFAFAGAACVVNARRCGRRHCFYVGPLYLLAALASLLYGLHVVQIGVDGWDWIIGVALAGTLFFCCVLEKLLGKYTAGH